MNNLNIFKKLLLTALLVIISDSVLLAMQEAPQDKQSEEKPADTPEQNSDKKNRKRLHLDENTGNNDIDQTKDKEEAQEPPQKKRKIDEAIEALSRLSLTLDALHIVAADQQQNINLNALLTIKAIHDQINKINNSGDTPLIIATKSHNLYAIKTLVSWGANLETPGIDGDIPFLEAIYSGSPEMVKVFLSFKGIDASLNCKSTKYKAQTPLIYAASQLYEAKKKDDVELAIRILEILNLLLDKKNVDVNKQDSLGYTALHYATLASNDELVNALLNKGANAALQTSNSPWANAFTFATLSELKIETVEKIRANMEQHTKSAEQRTCSLQ